jgi:DNA-binding LytR/AlgR family response regulator
VIETEPKICALVIDSSAEEIEQTTNILKGIPLVKNIVVANHSDEALMKLIEFNPHIIFMNYPLIGNSNNQLLKYIKSNSKDATVVCTSQSKNHAHQAINDGIFNYLVKPISKEDIIRLIDEVALSFQSNNQDRINKIIENSAEDIKIKLQTAKGYLFINPDELLYCKADGFYSQLILTGDRVELCYLLLAKLETIFSQFNFTRVSRSYLINLKYIRKILRANNTIILSYEGKEYEVKGSKLQIRNLSKLEYD